MENYKTAVIIGRFQSPYLHEGHKHLINSALNHPGINDLFIFIGTQEKIDERNPYSFEERQVMIQEEYPYAMTGYLPDIPNNDLMWSRSIDEILIQLNAPVLFGSRDSFYSHYKGIFPYISIPEIEHVSATELRNASFVDRVLNVSKRVPERTITYVQSQLSEEIGELATEISIKYHGKKRATGDDGILGEAIDSIINLIDIIYLDNPKITSKEIQTVLDKKLKKWYTSKK